MRTCKIDDCDRKYLAKDLCSMHYERRRHGYDMSKEARITNDDMSRFMQYIELIPFSNCWHWLGARHPRGYGSFLFRKTIWRAHRASWTLHKGEIPKGMQLNHLCHNSGCVNPDHLYIGTQIDNIRDRDVAGNTFKKLSDKDALLIFKAKGTQQKIADEFGISQTHVNQIKHKVRRKALLVNE